MAKRKNIMKYNRYLKIIDTIEDGEGWMEKYFG